MLLFYYFNAAHLVKLIIILDIPFLFLHLVLKKHSSAVVCKCNAVVLTAGDAPDVFQDALFYYFGCVRFCYLIMYPAEFVRSLCFLKLEINSCKLGAEPEHRLDRF